MISPREHAALMERKKPSLKTRSVAVLGLLASCHIALFFAPVAIAQVGTAAEAEVQKCEDRIAAVQREILNRYEDSLQELQNGFQKSADLESALAVRAERQRVAKEGNISEKAFVGEPKSLRALQAQTLAKIQELIGQIVQETVPRLIEHKKSLTVSGKLDEAVTIREAIEKLQNNYAPLAKPDPSVAVPADTLLQAYLADRGRADKAYKGQKFTVRGVLGGYRVDPNDSKQYLVYVTGNASGGGWVQCAFVIGEYRFREDKQFNNTTLVVISKDGDAVVGRWQKGQVVEIRGTCDGWDEVVKLGHCDIPR